MTTAASKWRRKMVVVGVVALLLSAAFMVRVLAAFDWDPSAFTGFGSEGPTHEYAKEHLGEVILRGELGHDGKYFFVQANDPWLLDTADNAKFLDFPIYRSQRMLYPLLAGGFGLFGPEMVLWGLLLVNVAAMVLGTIGAARLSMSLGGSPWWGLAFLTNLGLIFSLTIDSADIVATALVIWAVALIYEGRLSIAIGLLASTALTREVMLLCAAGVAVWLWSEQRRRQAVYAIMVPTLALTAWEIYLRIRLEPDEPGVRAVGTPLVGLARAASHWLVDPVVLAMGACVVLLAALFVVHWWRRRSLLGWAFIGFVPLALVLTEKVWMLYFDFTRALAPMLTASILLIFVEGRMPSNEEERKVFLTETSDE